MDADDEVARALASAPPALLRALVLEQVNSGVLDKAHVLEQCSKLSPPVPEQGDGEEDMDLNVDDPLEEGSEQGNEANGDNNHAHHNPPQPNNEEGSDADDDDVQVIADPYANGGRPKRKRRSNAHLLRAVRPRAAASEESKETWQGIPVVHQPTTQEPTPPFYTTCRRLSLLVRDKRESVPFHEPVDIDACPDYLDIIKSPMDMLTIYHKLENRAYKTYQEFVDDYHLIFSNAITYSQRTKLDKEANKDIADKALFLRAVFNREEKKVRERMQRAARDKAPVPKRSRPSRSSPSSSNPSPSRPSPPSRSPSPRPEKRKVSPRNKRESRQASAGGSNGARERKGGDRHGDAKARAENPVPHHNAAEVQGKEGAVGEKEKTKKTNAGESEQGVRRPPEAQEARGAQAEPRNAGKWGAVARKTVGGKGRAKLKASGDAQANGDKGEEVEPAVHPPPREGANGVKRENGREKAGGQQQEGEGQHDDGVPNLNDSDHEGDFGL